MSMKNSSGISLSSAATTGMPPSLQADYVFGRGPEGDSFIASEETRAETEKYGKYFDNLAIKNNINLKTAEMLLASLFEAGSTVSAHCSKVSVICEAIARKMNLSRMEISEIKTAGILHDIGKKHISEEVLNKPGKLTEDEWMQIKQHSEFGSIMLKTICGFSRIADFIMEHHEKWDGKGYPKGLRGEEISLQARIIAVADAFDAMTSDRPYKKAVGRDEAAAEIQANAGTHFDPSVVEAFMEVFKPEVRYA